MVRVAIAILASVLMASTAHAKRMALVVGINMYDNLPRERQLAKAVNDARAMEAALKAVGFDVIKAEDVGRSAFNQAWQQLLNKLVPGDEVAVFFSGHGVEIEGGNYLVPRDVPAVGTGEARRLKNESLSFDEMRRDLAAQGPKLSLFILDACRDNPFADTRGRSIGGAKGLVPVQAEYGTFIMFAAGARESALDRLSDTDNDPNSIYTRKLLPLLEQPGLRLPDVAQRVRGEVRRLAGTVGHRQSPAYYDEGADDICLAGCAKPPPTTASAPEVSEAAREWARVDKASLAELETFVRRHGVSPEADYARARIEQLKKERVAVAVPPKAPEPITIPLNTFYKGQTPTQAIESTGPLMGIPVRDADGSDLGTVSGLIFENGETVGLIFNHLGKMVGIRIKSANVSTDTTRGRSSVKLGLKNASEVLATLEPYQRLAQPTRCVGVEAQVGNERRCLKPKDSFKDCPECPEMVVVPAGDFMMGSANNEEGRFDNEGPQHSVTIATSFAVGKFEVTFAEWDGCVAEGGCKHRPGDQGWGRGKRPVINVSWDDISKEFLPWLSRKSGRTYRFLTEAEWEYAARAGTTTPFSTGLTISTTQAHFGGWARLGAAGAKTNSVGLFPPNTFGLHDMHGNAWEWVADCYEGGYSNSRSDGKIASEASGCSRVLRGGSWVYPAPRAALRIGYPPGSRSYDYGFRLARTLSP